MRAFASRRLGDLWLWILRGLAIGFASRREGRRKLFALEGEVPSSAVDYAASLLTELTSAILEVLTALAGSLAQFRKGFIAFPGSEQQPQRRSYADTQTEIRYFRTRHPPLLVSPNNSGASQADVSISRQNTGWRSFLTSVPTGLGRTGRSQEKGKATGGFRIEGSFSAALR